MDIMLYSLPTHYSSVLLDRQATLQQQRTTTVVLNHFVEGSPIQTYDCVGELH